MAQLQKESEIEVWDDGDFDGIDNLQFRNVSSTTTASARPKQRESIGSRMSMKSDQEDDGDWQVLLANDDDVSTKNAIENAKQRGIPLPANVPPSALLGGTIKKLGSRRSKKAMGDDWDEDLEFPAPGGLKLKVSDGKEFPDTIRNVSGAASNASSPSKGKSTMSFMERLQAAGSASVLDKFKDDVDDFFDDVPTIKIAKARVPVKLPNFTHPTETTATSQETDTFEDDFELPASGQLKLSSRAQTPRTPASQVFDDFDQDWAEGSHGSFGSINTSNSGVKRLGKSARSSSISARSPSIFSPTLSSCLTAESEDEGLDGLVLPVGPLNFGDALKRRIGNASPDSSEPTKIDMPPPAKDDFLEGLELGPGPIFDAGKLTLNRNIKQRPVRQTSPPRRPATSLTFTNKASSSNTRIPKPATGMERPRSKLEPVSESGGPMSHYRSTASRMGSHSQQSSLTSLPTPTSSTTSSIPPPSTPSRRLATRASREILRPESAQNNILKSKRSLPAMSSVSRVAPSPARPPQPPFQRPSSRQDRPLRPTLVSRPRTPVDRAESSLAAARRPSAYALNGTTVTQPRQLTKQGSRTFHRPTSSDSVSENPAQQPARSNSRLSDRLRSNTPSARRDLANKSLARVAATKRVTEPVRRRGYGDGTELDAFDDLPTSATSEAKFTKQPAGAIKANANRRPLSGISQASLSNVNRSDAPSRLTFSPTKNDNNLPSFARSTAASRLAREQRLAPNANVNAQRHSANVENHSPATSNWKHIINSKPPPSPRPTRRPMASKEPPRKPQLIHKIGAPIAKGGHGMHWNEQLGRWEGNEAALAPFDIPSSPKRAIGGANNTSPITKPALIANFGTTKGVQVVGGMVFDPERMMWVKMSAVTKANNARMLSNPRTRSDSLTNTTATDEAGIFDLDLNMSISEDDDDPFAGIADLPDENIISSTKSAAARKHARKSKSKSNAATASMTSPNLAPSATSPFNLRSASCSSSSSDDDLAKTAEEFDVGPGFVKRQQAEEEKWKRRLKGWGISMLADGNAVTGSSVEKLTCQRNELRDLIMIQQRALLES